MNTAFPTSLNTDITPALGTVDTMIPTFTNNFDPKTFTSMFGKDSTVLEKDRACRTAPLNTQMRDATARTGCGWWHIPNSDLTSVGAYGTRRGPMSPTLDTTYGAGEWIWDLNAATQKEGIKAGSRIRKCDDIANSSYPNMGWCVSTGRGVVTDGKGNPAFPSNPQGNCPASDIRMPGQCDPLYTCKGLGYASSDGNIRLYSQQDCGSMNGIWYGSGECLKAGGGSWSWDCRGLNTGSPSMASAANECKDGSMSAKCVADLVNQQCNTTGSLSQGLMSGFGSEKVNDMNTVLLERGLSLPQGILKDGNITRNTATQAITTLKGWGNDPNPRTAGAANNLCYGTAFDMCGFSNSTPKPFSLPCIKRTAQAAGWSPAGTSLANLTDWNLATWGDVLSQISSWKRAADNPGPKQLDFIKKVYGIAAVYPNRCPSIKVLEHCGPTGENVILPGAGTFYAGKDFGGGASYVIVPAGASAILVNAQGATQTVVGPGEFNFCSRGGFNDNVKQIIVYPSNNPPAFIFDYGKTYGKNEKAIYDGSIFQLNNYIGAAGYTPYHYGGALWKNIGPAPTEDTYGNNGTVSCQRYCGGVGGQPWNSELPVNWKGAKCVKTNKPGLDCNTAPGLMDGLVCTCAPMGIGWN